MEQIFGYSLALLIGLSLGLIGSGGSILTVPVLVYVMQINPVLATAYSLFIVGATALVGGVQQSLRGQVDFRTAAVFGLPSIAAVFATRAWIMPIIPDPVFQIGTFPVSKGMALMLLFAILMVPAAYSMIRTSKKPAETEGPKRFNYPIILLEGALVGVLTGLVGAGGGFLIIPALVLLARLPMKLAVGTSLFIIAAKSLIGFTGDLKASQSIDWTFLVLFTAVAVAGIFAGGYLAKFIPGEKLKKGFGWFVLAMSAYIIFNEFFKSGGSAGIH